MKTFILIINIEILHTVHFSEERISNFMGYCSMKVSKAVKQHKCRNTSFMQMQTYNSYLLLSSSLFFQLILSVCDAQYAKFCMQFHGDPRPPKILSWTSKGPWNHPEWPQIKTIELFIFYSFLLSHSLPLSASPSLTYYFCKSLFIKGS